MISILVEKKLNDEINQVLYILQRGFDVQVYFHSPEIEKIFIAKIEDKLKKNPEKFRFICDEQTFSFEVDGSFDLANRQCPLLFVNSKGVKVGYGFINYYIDSKEKLIGTVASAIQTVLENFGLEMYLEVFDSQKLSYLKQILQFQGLGVLIDTVIQVAYLSGFKGNMEKANELMEQLIQEKTFENKEESKMNLEKSAEHFLSYIMTKEENAYPFLKASLSYFVVQQQKLSMTKASQLLKISRTTLQEYLKVSERLNVAQIFPLHSQKSCHAGEK